MNIEQLNDYANWAGQSPAYILKQVKKVGGWKKVFGDRLPPLWAHRIRNYFNQEPIFMNRLEYMKGFFFILSVHNISIALDWNMNSVSKIKDKISKLAALSGDVYRDEYNHIWYQMSPGATIYHFKKEVKSQVSEAAIQTYLGQQNTPVFKLVSPDGSGGSRETIINNLQNQTQIGEVGVVEQVAPLTKTDPLFQGSYNYAETIKSGINFHNKYDVETHVLNTDYITLSDRYTFWTRKFPKFAPNEATPLAEQIKYS